MGWGIASGQPFSTVATRRRSHEPTTRNSCEKFFASRA